MHRGVAIIGPTRLNSQAGPGRLGVVFVALDAELNREAALKQILDHPPTTPLAGSGSWSKPK
jgi:hypothetical protein